MDPNANRDEQLRIAARIVEAFENDRTERPFPDYAHDAARLAELVIALDNWIRAGGFLPNPWRHA